MSYKFNPNDTRINAPFQSDIYAYVQKTPAGRFRYMTYNPEKVQPRKSTGKICGTWSEPGSPEHKAAFQNLERLLYQMAQVRKGAIPKVESAEGNFIGFIEYLEQRRALEPHANTRRSRWAIQYAKRAIPATVKLHELNYNHFLELRNTLTANVSNETARNYLAWIKGQLSKAAREFSWIDRNPWQGCGVPVGNYHSAKHRKQRLTLQELHMLKHAKTQAPHILKAFLFACATGVGRAEIDHLTHGDIKRRLDGTGEMRFIRRKTRKHAPRECVVYLTADTLQLIGEKQSASTPLFPELPSPPAVTKALRNAQASVGLNREDITFYCGRHTFICLHIEKGTPYHEIQEMTGHASLNALMRYAKSVKFANRSNALDLGFCV